jgi:hypothetical protein
MSIRRDWLFSPTLDASPIIQPSFRVSAGATILARRPCAGHGGISMVGRARFLLLGAGSDGCEDDSRTVSFTDLSTANARGATETVAAATETVEAKWTADARATLTAAAQENMTETAAWAGET